MLSQSSQEESICAPMFCGVFSLPREKMHGCWSLLGCLSLVRKVGTSCWARIESPCCVQDSLVGSASEARSVLIQYVSGMCYLPAKLGLHQRTEDPFMVQ